MGVLVYWRAIAVAIIIASAAAFCALWRHEVDAYATYRAQVAAAAEVAQQEAEATRARHDQATREISDAWTQAVPAIEAHAVDRYRAAHPGGVQQPTCGGLLPTVAQNAQGIAGAGREPLPDRGSSCEPDAGFIRACARDAGRLELCRAWIERIGFGWEE